MATPATEALQSLDERKAQRRARRLDPTAASPATANADTDEQELINRVEHENPIFKAFEDKTLSQQDKIKAIAKLLEFDPAEPDNDKRIEILGAFFEYVQLQRRNMALGQINTVSDQAYATFKQNMDGVFEDLNTFKGSLAPLDEVLGLLKKFRSGEGAGKKSVIEQINDAFRQQKMLKEARQSRDQDIAQLTGQTTRLRSDRGMLQSTFNQNNTFFGTLLRAGLLADIAWPESKTKLPAIISVHGGRWKAGHKRDASTIKVDQWAGFGFFAMSVDYRLVGCTPAPAWYQDVQCAIRYVHAHADQYNIDTSRIFLIGQSAGEVLLELARAA